MNDAWFQVMSMLYGYFAAGVIAVAALCTLRKLLSDAALLRRVKKSTPQLGACGALCVLSAGTRRLPAGTLLRVPYEGTLGSSHSCDVCIPYRKVHLRSAFFWMERDGLHMVALHRDGFTVDEVAVEPGDEAILGDGAVLRVRELKLVLSLYPAAAAQPSGPDIGPYVTTERKSRAQQGRGEGIGAPGKHEVRREERLRRKKSAKADAPAKGAANRKEAGKGRRAPQAQARKTPAKKR